MPKHKKDSSPKAAKGKAAKPQSAPQSSLVRVLDQPPTQLPCVLLDDLVPFPGAMVPLLLDSKARREAMHQAKNNSGIFLLINRRDVKRRPDMSEMVVTDLQVVEGEVSGEGESGLGGAGATGLETVLEIAVEMQDQDTVKGAGRRLHMTDEVDARELVDDERRGTVDAEKRAQNDSRDDEDEPIVSIGQLSPVGIAARLVKVVRLPDDRLSALVQLLRRVQPLEVVLQTPCPSVRVMYPAEVIADAAGFEAAYRQVRLTLQAFFEAHPTVSDEIKMAAMNMEVPGSVADFVAQHLSRDFQERVAFLGELDLGKRMHRALEVAIRELDLLTVGNRISQEIRDKVEKHQRDFLLREQLKSIRAELGEEKDPATMAIAELQEKLDKAGLTDIARTRADDELRRLQLLPSEAPEYNVVRSYIEWISSLPWSHVSEDSHDIDRARAVLDEDHYGLDEVKDRIIEFLAVHQLNPKKTGTLMCFAGPPGVGKTSLGQSIAKALGREFYRFSVGGMRDEAEIKGHRRTYIGAMPGRILQGLRQVKTANPVFMLDELDKIGADWRGDPSSALLEVLDPAQNKNFVDHYLDLPFDLSRVMFIATVNNHTEMPGPLRDRLEIIDLPSYIPEEKLEIAARYLLPRQRKEHGLATKDLNVGRPALKRVIQEYTQEAGVRDLERMIGKVCRKRALAVVQTKVRAAQAKAFAAKKSKKAENKRVVSTHATEAFIAKVGPETVPAYLGAPRKHDDQLMRRNKPGVVVGLAWTSVGGEILFIEAVAMPGKGNIKVTGHLGEVMSESAGLALSYVRDNAASFGIEADAFTKHDFHLHFPAGAVKKDGPSAGVTVTCAIISLLTQTPIKQRVAMTGEMTLRGEVLPVGGIREKVVAARRAGVTTVIVPARNRADVLEIPKAVTKTLKFVYAEQFDDVQQAAIGALTKAPKAKKTR